MRKFFKIAAVLSAAALVIATQGAILAPVGLLVAAYFMLKGTLFGARDAAKAVARPGIRFAAREAEKARKEEA